MSRTTKMFFKWCPAPEPPTFGRLRHFAKPIILFITTAVFVASILATSFALSSTASVVAPIADQLQKSVTSNPTPTPTATATPNSIVPRTDKPIPIQNTPATQSPFTVSGYVTDSSGNGIEGAEIIFCVPDIIPAVFTDSSGHYQASAPAGTYHIYVWPPFNSSYISYEQLGFVVNSNVAKNVSLSTGYKLSGYITDSGKPVNGAVVALNQYFNGYYSTVNGYYYVVAPAGNYTLTAQPKTGVSFSTYSESNVIISGDTYKDITIANQTKYKISGFIQDSNGNALQGAQIIFGVPNIVPSVLSNSAGYFETYAPAGTYCLDIWPPFDSDYLSYEQQGFTVAGVVTRNFTLTQGYKVSGYITTSTGSPISGAIAALGNHISGWYSKSSGYYFVTAPAGNYTLTVQPRTGPNFTAYSLNNLIVTGNTIQNITVS